MHSSVADEGITGMVFVQPQFVSRLSRFQLHHMLLAGIAGTEMT